jgi:hypothetical protein
MAKKVSMIQTIERVWDIEGFPNYFFGQDKRLYRFDSRGRVKINKRLVIGTTQSCVLKTKFFSLSQLRPLLRRHGEADGTTLVP